MIDQRIGNYRLVRKLGEGGMGEVYEGVHEQIGRRVAIKILHSQLSRDPKTTSRFVNEARLVSMLQHPGIVYTFEFGQLPDQTAYMIMEYLDGETLRARLKAHDGRLGSSSLFIVRQIASALAVAHAQGIIHRDLKPDNIMIVRDAESATGERAKILDFGIAKAHGPEDPAGIKTGTGVLMGTPLYMSPEQCRGRGEITAKSDVYSLGIMLFQMLSGRMPLGGGGSGELIAQHLYMDPLTLRAVDPTAPVELEQLVSAMLSKNPEARPDMREVIRQLEKLGAERSQQVPALLNAAQRPPSPSWPVVVEMTPTPTTTLGSAAGDPGSLAGKSQKRALRLGLAGAAVVALIFVGVGLQRFRQAPALAPVPASTELRASAAAQPVSAAPAAKVRWRLNSVPPGAQVVRTADQKALGITPWETEMPEAEAKTQLVLRLRGYVDQPVELDQRQGGNRQEQLRPIPPARVGAVRGNVKGKISAVKSSKKPAKEEVSDDEIRIIK